MSDFAEFFDRGRKALLAGRTKHEQPMAEGGSRWGAAAVLRPEPGVSQELADLAREVGAAVGQGHWVHDRHALHFTLRSLENYRSAIPADDPLRLLYREALEEAAEGLPSINVTVRGVSPHAGGVLVCGYPVDDSMVRLQQRLALGLERRGVQDLEFRMRDQFVRNLWYVSLVHFTGPVADPKPVVAWCDDHADTVFGLSAPFGRAHPSCLHRGWRSAGEFGASCVPGFAS